MNILVGVICIVRFKGKILLIKREKAPYKGLYALPGGKIEYCEHPKQAALREVSEESGIIARFEKVLGMLSEVLEHNGEKKHFVLFVCELTAPSTRMTPSREGELTWLDERNWNSVREKLIPSDWTAVRDFLFERNSKMELREVKMCTREKKGKTCYALEEFTST